jgi:hypothetical protein
LDGSEHWGSNDALWDTTKGIPPEMHGSTTSKATTKITRDSIKTLHVDVDRVCQEKANTLRHEFNTLIVPPSDSFTQPSSLVIDLIWW